MINQSELTPPAVLQCSTWAMTGSSGLSGEVVEVTRAELRTRLAMSAMSDM